MKYKILFIILLLSICPVKTFAFSDIQYHWARANIEKGIIEEIINGYDDNTFRPDNSITRAEFTTIFMRALQLSNTGGLREYYYDLKEEDWYFSYMKDAANLGFIIGYSDRTIKPLRNVTREEAVIMLFRAYNIPVVDLTAEQEKRSDYLSVSPWASRFVEQALRRGYIDAPPGSSIRPKDSLTRAEAIVLIYRIAGTAIPVFLISIPAD